MQKYNVAIIIAVAVGQGFCLHKVLVPDVAYLMLNTIRDVIRLLTTKYYITPFLRTHSLTTQIITYGLPLGRLI
jgi:hypothetical protein